MAREEAIEWLEGEKRCVLESCEESPARDRFVQALSMGIEALRAIGPMAKHLARSGDICDLCANREKLPLDDCEDADCNCDICKANCACAGCEDGSSFMFREETKA